MPWMGFFCVFVCNRHWEGWWSACRCSNSGAHWLWWTCCVVHKLYNKSKLLQIMISFAIVSYTLCTTSTLTLVVDYFDFSHYLCNQWSWRSLGLGKEMRIFDIMKDISSLLITINIQYAKHVTTQPPHFKIEPLLEYCIDHPNIENFIVYKVPTRVHPWGVNFIFVTPKIWDYNFKDFSLCVRKVDWMLHTYVVIGGWWILMTLDGSKLSKIDQVLFFVFLCFFQSLFITCDGNNVEERTWSGWWLTNIRSCTWEIYEITLYLQVFNHVYCCSP